MEVATDPMECLELAGEDDKLGSSLFSVGSFGLTANAAAQ